MTSKGKGLKEQVSSVCVSHGRRLTPSQESRGNFKEMLHTASRYNTFVERSDIAGSDKIYQSAMQDLQRDPPTSCSAGPSSDDLFQWQVRIWQVFLVERA